jgi:hypothetical protein
LLLRSRAASLLLAFVAGMTVLIALLVWLGPLRDLAGIGVVAMLIGAAILVWGAVTELGGA